MTITVHCPSCETSFPVDTDKVPEGGVDARCSVCSAVFRVEKPTAAEQVEGLAHEESDDLSTTAGAATAREPASGEADQLDVDSDPDVVEAREGPAEEAEPEARPAWKDEAPTAEVEPEARPAWEDEAPAEEAEPEVRPAWEDEAVEEPGVEEPDDVVTTSWDMPEAEPRALEAEPLDTGRPEPETVEADVEPDFPSGAEMEVVDPSPTGAAEPEEGAAPDTVPAPAEPPAAFQFGKRDPHEKAQRLARVLVSDMIMYNPERHGRALDGGTLKDDFDEEIRKSWDEYVDQVGEEMAVSTTYFSDALNDILARGEQVFEGNPPH